EVHDKVFLDPSNILKSNSQFVDCHSQTHLRESNWTHDFHAKNLTFSNCQDVHDAKTKEISNVSQEIYIQCVYSLALFA
ncbi:cytochrome c nitrite reductase pentaheme subunit, partial [Vibrio parahaemolyticus]|nr:cytochrome c nitrite reductase pentaheme subunit [Vibrio parahaemolyticus]